MARPPSLKGGGYVNGYAMQAEMVVTRQDAEGGPTVQTVIVEQDFDANGQPVGDPREVIGPEVHING